MYIWLPTALSYRLAKHFLHQRATAINIAIVVIVQCETGLHLPSFYFVFTDNSMSLHLENYSFFLCSSQNLGESRTLEVLHGARTQRLYATQLVMLKRKFAFLSRFCFIVDVFIWASAMYDFDGSGTAFLRTWTRRNCHGSVYCTAGYWRIC